MAETRVPDSNRPPDADNIADADTVPATPGSWLGLDAEVLISIPGYDIDGVLGRGGMGIVYKARHKNLQRTVALKVILAGPHASREELARFWCEAESVAQLRHPNVVQVYDVGQQDGWPYFSLEFVDGGNLSQKIDRTPFPPKSAARLTESIARAVHAAHSLGIIHRDLKPSNILLTSEGQPKVTDFGLAKRLHAASSQTMPGEVVGTPNYMAPEQAEGRKGVGTAIDVYGLGAILYELLTGRPPFEAETAHETIARVLSEEPTPPHRLNPGLPRKLETICLKCLEKDPVRRYPSASAVGDDLLCFLRDEPISARAPNVFARASRWARLRPALAATLIALTLFYLNHLAMMAFGVEGAGGADTHIFLTTVMAAWAIFAAASQRLYSRTRREWIIFMWSAVDVLMLTLLVWRDGGPRSALLPFYFVLVSGTTLRLRKTLAWFVTGLSFLAYVMLLVEAAWRRPHLAVETRTWILFCLGLIVLGLIQHLLLRRMRTEIASE